MPTAIEMRYSPTEFPVPPDVRRIGTLIRFPILPDTATISLRTLSMTHGTMTLFFPKPNATDVRISYKIDTFAGRPQTENQESTSSVSLVQMKDGTFLYPKERFAEDGEFPVTFRSKTLAILKRDGITQVEIVDRTGPVDILLNERDTLYADVDTPDGVSRVSFHDFTPHTYAHTAITFIQTGKEYHATYEQVRKIQTTTGDTLCVVQVLI